MPKKQEAKPQNVATLDDLFGRNLENEDAGMWVEIVSGVKVKVRYNKSAEYQRIAKRVLTPNTRRQIQKKLLSAGKQQELQVDLIVKGILVDWEGVVGSDGKEIPFSVDAAKEILMQRKYSEFLEAIDEASSYRETFLDEIKEDDSKN